MDYTPERFTVILFCKWILFRFIEETMVFIRMTQPVILLIITINTVASLDNVALGKPASQSGTNLFHNYGTADKAVDGDKDDWGFSCAYPDTSTLSGAQYDQPAWWRVDLGDSFDVYKVIITNSDSHRGILSDTWVQVSDEKYVIPDDDNICNFIRNGQQREVTLTCDYRGRTPPIRGRYVTLRRNHNATERHVMNFCEVEALSCHPGFWGKDMLYGDCSRPCGHCVEETCRVSDGHCYTGCEDGFWGDSCKNECNCSDCDRLTGCTAEGDSQSNERDTTWTKLMTATTTPKETTESGLGNGTEGVIVGLVVGMVVLAIILIIGVITVSLLYKRYKKLQRNQNPLTDISMETQRTDPEGSPGRQITAVYDEIHECEGQKQDKEEKQYENNEVAEKKQISLKPMVMQTIRDHIQSTNSKVWHPLLSHDYITLPELVYDYVYDGRQPIPVPLKDVKIYVQQIQEQIVQFKEYEEEVEVLYTALIDRIETADTGILCSQFSSVYNQLKEINSDTLKSTLQEQYQILEMLKPLDDRTLKSGLLPENIGKNRNRDIVPSDRLRARLRTSTDGGTDYINAVVVTGINVGENYILTQSPMKETVADLWRLVNEYNSSTIVMLNQISPEEEQSSSVVVYWPPEIENSLEFGSMIIMNNSYNVDSKNKNLNIRELGMIMEDNYYESLQETIKQFSIMEWNQSTQIRDFIRLIELVEERQSELPLQTGPVVIHCLNGLERSGLFCASLYVAQQIKTQEKVDIFSAVKHIRLYRPQCITDMEQYIFLHEFAEEYIKLKHIEKFQTEI